jgi:hypothetical protein
MKFIFPVLEGNKISDLKYKKDVPDFKYFNNLSLSEYKDYKMKFINKI